MALSNPGQPFAVQLPRQLGCCRLSNRLRTFSNRPRSLKPHGTLQRLGFLALLREVCVRYFPAAPEVSKIELVSAMRAEEILMAAKALAKPGPLPTIGKAPTGIR